MAQIIKNIKIGDRKLKTNEFQLTFQLAGSSKFAHRFVAHYSKNRIYLPETTASSLSDVGIEDLTKVSVELSSWTFKPRRSLAGETPGQMMQREIAISDAAAEDRIKMKRDYRSRVEAERQGKAEAERVAVEAPCFDWAMSVTEELVDEENVIRAAMNADSVHSSLSPFEELEVISRAIQAGYGIPPRGSETSLFFATYPDWTLEKRIKAVDEHITSMEAVGFGEEPVQAKATVDPSEQSRLEDEICYQYRKKIAEDRTELAVNAIHSQARRFTKLMTLKEHDFLRDVIREEIEKVVGGVL
jgi:hypothetical protein